MTEINTKLLYEQIVEVCSAYDIRRFDPNSLVHSPIYDVKLLNTTGQNVADLAGQILVISKMTNIQTSPLNWFFASSAFNWCSLLSDNFIVPNTSFGYQGNAGNEVPESTMDHPSSILGDEDMMGKPEVLLLDFLYGENYPRHRNDLAMWRQQASDFADECWMSLAAWLLSRKHNSVRWLIIRFDGHVSKSSFEVACDIFRSTRNCGFIAQPVTSRPVFFTLLDLDEKKNLNDGIGLLEYCLQEWRSVNHGASPKPISNVIASIEGSSVFGECKRQPNTTNTYCLTSDPCVLEMCALPQGYNEQL